MDVVTATVVVVGVVVVVVVVGIGVVTSVPLIIQVNRYGVFKIKKNVQSSQSIKIYFWYLNIGIPWDFNRKIWKTKSENEVTPSPNLFHQIKGCKHELKWFQNYIRTILHRKQLSFADQVFLRYFIITNIWTDVMNITPKIL